MSDAQTQVDTNGAGSSPAVVAQAIHAEGSAAAKIMSLQNIPAGNITQLDVPFSFKGTTDPNTKEKIPARPKLTLQIPVPTWEGLISTLSEENPEDPKVQNYVMRLIRDDIISAARQQVSPVDETTKQVDKQEDLDLSKLTVSYLAAQPESERRGGGIAKEVWEAFEKAYVEVQTKAGGKDVEKASNAAKLFVKRYQPVRTQKKVLTFLKGELDRAFSFFDAEQAEEYSSIYEFLVKKVDDLLKMDDEALLSNL